MPTADISQTSLREPEPADWDSFGKSTYQPPPPAMGPDGKPIVYMGAIDTLTETDPDEGYLNYQIDAKIVRSGAPTDGTKVRIWASTRPFTKLGPSGERVPIAGNPNKLGNLLRAVGVSAKPQRNAEYVAALKAIGSKPFPFTLDWVAKNRETGEVVKGYLNFPDDPDRPGMKKTVLKAGDVVTERDARGLVTGTRTIQSDVMFANVQFRYFQDAPPKVAK